MPVIALNEFLEHVIPAYYDSWAEAADVLAADAVEGETIKSLMTELASNNNFREPIYVEMLSVDTNSWSAELVNGMHRTVAHMLSNSLTVEYKEYIPKPFEPGDLSWVETEITGFKNSISSEEEYMKVWAILRSIRINSDLWVTADVCSISSDSDGSEFLSLTWDFEPGLCTFTDLESAAKGKLLASGCEVSSLTFRSNVFYESESLS